MITCNHNVLGSMNVASISIGNLVVRLRHILSHVMRLFLNKTEYNLFFSFLVVSRKNSSSREFEHYERILGKSSSKFFFTLCLRS